MRGIAQQGYPVKCPLFQRVPVIDRKFKYLFRFGDNARHVQPVEFPVAVEFDQVIRPGQLAPVFLLAFVRDKRDGGNPVDMAVSIPL